MLVKGPKWANSSKTKLVGISWYCTQCISFWVNSLAFGRFANNFEIITFKLIIQNNGLGTCCQIALRWKQQNLTNDKSTLVQVMAWCRQATSHYLKQCWPRSMLPYGVTRLQWVKLAPRLNPINPMTTWDRVPNELTYPIILPYHTLEWRANERIHWKAHVIIHTSNACGIHRGAI